MPEYCTPRRTIATTASSSAAALRRRERQAVAAWLEAHPRPLDAAAPLPTALGTDAPRVLRAALDQASRMFDVVQHVFADMVAPDVRRERPDVHARFTHAMRRHPGPVAGRPWTAPGRMRIKHAVFSLLAAHLRSR